MNNNIKNEEDLLRIDKTSNEPLYIQVEKLLKKLISINYFENKPRLLSEKFLIENLKVSRNTIRQATKNLINQGLIISNRPKGIIIVKNSLRIMEETVSGLSYTEAALRLNQKPTSKTSIFKNIFPPEKVAMQLLIGKTDKVFYCNRVRYINKVPVFINKFYIPEKIIPNLKESDIGESGLDQSLFYIIERKYGIEILMSVEDIKAVSININDAEILNIKKGLPVLNRLALIYAKDSRIVCYNETIFSNSYVIKGLIHMRMRS